jgi:hypothetical protein
MASVLQGLKAVTLLMLLLASALPGDCAGRDPHSREERRQASRRHQMRQPRVEKSIKVLDFSADSDFAPDDDGQYTGATLVREGTLPPSITLCFAYMLEAEREAAGPVVLLGEDGFTWASITIGFGETYTRYDIYVGDTRFPATHTGPV